MARTRPPLGLRSRLRAGERGAVSVAALGVAMAVVAAGAGTGFTLQRIAAADGPGEPRLTGGTAPALDCPGGRTVGEVADGDRIFAIATHDEIAGWLLIRDPANPARRWWIEDRYVEADASTGDLPETGCDGAPLAGDDGEPPASGETTTTEVAVTTTVAAPGATTTTATPTATTVAPGATTTTTAKPSGTTPTTAGSGSTTTTTAAPDTTPPSLSISRNPTEIWETEPGYCTGLAKQATIYATASDASGIASVRATWTVGNHHEDKSVASGSTTFGPYPANTVPSNTQQTVTVTVTAHDNAGNKTVRTTTVVVHSYVQCLG